MSWIDILEVDLPTIICIVIVWWLNRCQLREILKKLGGH